MNAVDIERAVTALSEAPFDGAEFPYRFLEAFGNKATTLERLRKGDSNRSDCGGVLQTGNIHIATAPAGEVPAALAALRASPATRARKCTYILATDGQSIEAENLMDGDSCSCGWADLPDHFGFFLALAGITTVRQIRENSFDIRATSKLNRLYVELLRVNPHWLSAARREDFDHFMARLIFCFFAEDTRIFQGAGLFTSTLEQMTATDASDTHEVLAEIFRAMDTPGEARAAAGIRSYAGKFPYVNGGLFKGCVERGSVPTFSKIARSYLLHVGDLDWKQINPDIFGSMIQAVADDEERGELGMHYTSVPNILKVLDPLFLDDLRTKLAEAGDGRSAGSARKLQNLLDRIARIRVFDPACGSGNFLVVAYKEMRRIEGEINRRLGKVDRRSAIPLTNFRGIEIRRFAAEIARLALVIAEYQCDLLYRGETGALEEHLPPEMPNWIVCGNALRIDWLDVCPPTRPHAGTACDDPPVSPPGHGPAGIENREDETFVCGNPPYKGHSEQSDEQKADLAALFASSGVAWKSLDYVAGWFFKFCEYASHGRAAAAFVSTNSICQGRQVAILWPYVLGSGLRIAFAHTSFRWRNLATRNAGVVVVIVGLRPKTDRLPRLYSEDAAHAPTMRTVSLIGPYLVPDTATIVSPRASPVNGLPSMDYGSKPADGGGLVITSSKCLDLVDGTARRFVRPYVGSDDFIDGKTRHCIWVKREGGQIDAAMVSPFIRRRSRLVSAFRSRSRKPQTRALASLPLTFAEMRQGGDESPHAPLIVPIHTGEDRTALPVGVLRRGSVVSNAAFALHDAPLWTMALIASRLHLVWIATVCGKLGTSYRYSNTLGWNTFPVPPLTDRDKDDLTRRAEEILLAREAHWPATIADLYDPDAMPDDLRAAHDRNDETLERVYIGRRFRNDTERLETLFTMYTQMTANDAGSRADVSGQESGGLRKKVSGR